MNRNQKWLAAFGMTGAAIAAAISITSNASVLLSNTEVAGITLNLSNYAQETVSEDTITEDTKKETVTADTIAEDTLVKAASAEDTAAVEKVNAKARTVSEPDRKSADKKKKKKPKEKEDFKLNLVYDRLGVAKVDNWLNIRKEPGTDKEIIGKLPKNAGCHIYKVNKDGWADIVSGGVRGWVKAEYLLMDEEAEDYAKKVATRMATTNTTTLNVRTLPTTDFRIYDMVGVDSEMDIKRKADQKICPEVY